MTPQQILPRLKHVDHTNADLGSGTVIVPDRHGAVVRLNLTADTSYTVPDPTRSGPEFFINHVSGAFTATITFASAYNEAGTTAFTMNSPGQIARFKACETASGTYAWRLMGSDTAVTAITGSQTVAGLLTGSAGIVAKSATAAAITTTRTLTSADSGGCFSVAKTSAYAITLPTPAQGLSFKFLALDTGANAVTISAGAANLFGVADIAGTPVVMTGTTITLVASGGIGDWVEFSGIDSTHYHVTGACVTAAKITAT